MGKKKKIYTTMAATVAAVGIMFVAPLTASAHCDTMDGPVIGDAQRALNENNINYITKWVMPENEAELTYIFNQTVAVRDDSAAAQKLADQYLLENLVRIHRTSEGAAYAGIKPEGTPVEEAVAAADASIATGNLNPMEEVIENEKISELEESFNQVLRTQEFDTDDVEAGREYVEAYVTFTHLSEELAGGEEEAHANEEHVSEDTEASEVAHETETKATSATVLPWSLAGLFFITTLIGHFRHPRKKA